MRILNVIRGPAHHFNCVRETQHALNHVRTAIRNLGKAMDLGHHLPDEQRERLASIKVMLENETEYLERLLEEL